MADPTLVITGSDGMFASYLKKEVKKAIWLGRKEMDINKIDSIKIAMKKYQPDVVLHLAGYTDVALAEVEKLQCYQTNVVGTGELARRSPLFIYMSTEYVFDGEKGNYHEGAIPNPVNFYSLSKLLGEREAMTAKRYCILRTLFKPRPYEHSVVPTDMWTSGDYADVVAKQVALCLEHALELPKVLNLGTDKKNLFELATQTKQVKPIKRISLPIRLPRDTSLDTTLWRMLNYEKQDR